MVIYKITNLLNNKVYIGQTVKSAAARFANHRYYLRKNWHHNEHIQRAWNKYGKDVFTFEVIESVLDMNIIDDRERYWIKLYDATNPSMGYNSESGGSLNKVMSTESRLKVSLSLIGNKRTLGYKHTEETKRKLAETTRQYNLKRGSHSETTKKKISEALSGPKSLHYGKPGVGRKQVYCINNKKVYESAVQASKDLKICRKALIKNCKGLRGNIKGYSFLFFEGNK